MKNRVHSRHAKERLTKHRRAEAKTPPPAPTNPVKRPLLPRWLVLGVCVLLVGGGVWAVFEFVVWSKVPAALVGKWVVTEGPDEGGTVDFYRDGTLVAKVNKDGYEAIIKARIRVEGNKIHVTTTHRETGEEGTRVQTIKVLEGNRLVLEDERGVSVKMERAE